MLHPLHHFLLSLAPPLIFLFMATSSCLVLLPLGRLRLALALELRVADVALADLDDD
jgi:hypothetical protein